ncbi:class I SAM-dependent methyltransferase [Herbiconiux sp. KACC 21604]|uniref:SAM-dependent methyltransferase n=1 Tax=unclassified Herbiconiux TaxID=2618217 RepID=UPI0020A57E5E|nr:class I SAM-dependent methyltransferase [Herbiconiux sp. SALV-R1]WPO85256.1 class I SAM-dependent methyltransferase [Herbiconiux sp. KACC 21604]
MADHTDDSAHAHTHGHDSSPGGGGHAGHGGHSHGAGRTMPSTEGKDAITFWEELYQQTPQIWSGRPNKVLADVAAELQPGTALDLGSGEGGDSLWLAERGWQVTAIDISPTALQRSAAEAERRGLPADRIRWQQADLTDWQPTGEYDLVSACFLHSPVGFPREDVLRRAASAVAPGGSLLVVGHLSFPSSAAVPEEERPYLPTPDELLALLALPESEWQVEVSEVRWRRQTGPDGEVELDDAVLLVTRR